ncbi:MAG: hypothetical protein HQL28_07295 [Candidatus Omnitrophica bacterium]|nr:hypothetical protein [Candidatus Omnitrophota bacterium]
MLLRKINFLFFFKSIRSRLVFGYIFFVLASVVILLGFLYFQMDRQFTENTRNFLEGRLKKTVRSGLEAKNDASGLAGFLAGETAREEWPFNIKYAVFSADGRLIAKSGDFSEDQSAVRKAGRGILKSGAMSELVTKTDIINTNSGGMFFSTQGFLSSAGKLTYLQLGMERYEIRGMLAIYRKALVLIVPMILVISVLGGVILTSRVLAPVSVLNNAVKKISLTGEEQNLSLTGAGDELDGLAASFNKVFGDLKESYRRIAAFTADASHELRLPITAIKGEAEVVLERERDLDEYQRVLGSIIEEMDRLMKMINRLLSLARADSGEDRLIMEEVDLKDLLEKLTDFYSALATAKEQELVFKAPAEGEFVLLADEVRLEELFSNLFENAIKYTPEKGNIDVILSKTGESFSVSVKDTGIGISHEHQKKIFERFYRVNKARSREDGGAGLGLSIAQMIARAHRGDISVKSVPSEGSEFTVILPTN